MNGGKTRCIILQVTDYGESDKLVTLYSPELGKITAIAKGAKRSKQRFVNKLEVCSLLQIMYRPPRTGGLFFLSEAELEQSFLTLRQHYSPYVAAMFISELVLCFTRERDPDPNIFTLLLWAFSSLQNGFQPRPVAALFHLRLLGACGYDPDLRRCGRCRSPITNKRVFSLHPDNGGLLCNHCAEYRASSRFILSLQTLTFLHNAQHLALENLQRLKMPDRVVDETLSALHYYSRHLMQRDIHSWPFVQRLTEGRGQAAPMSKHRSSATANQFKQLLGTHPGADICALKQ